MYGQTVAAGSGMSLQSLGIDKTTWDALTPEGRKELLQKTAAGYQTQKELLSGYDDYVSSLNSLQVEKAGVQAAVSAAEAELKKSGVSYTDIEKYFGRKADKNRKIYNKICKDLYTNRCWFSSCVGNCTTTYNGNNRFKHY